MTYCTNKNIPKCLILMGLILGLASSCAKEEKSAAKAGGVDGSGGNLTFIDDQSFASWLNTDHKYYVRDLIHHLEELKKNSPQDLNKIPYDLVNRFLGEKPGEVQKLASSATYYSLPGSCPAKNHDSSDASITPDGKICFSYRAFKNLSINDGIRKLLVMTMHELSHLRGFNEEDAQRLQLLFDRTYFGDTTILTFNEHHRQSKEVLKKISEKLGYAMKIILRRNLDAKHLACSQVAIANDRIKDVYYSYQSLPSHLKEPISNSIAIAINKLDNSCLENSDVRNAQELAQILASLADLARGFERYESPLCKGELCAQTRFLDSNAEQILLEWKLKKDLFEKGIKYPNKRSVSCELMDAKEDKTIELKMNEYGSYDLKELNPKEFRFGVTSIETESSFSGDEINEPNTVNLEHLGAVQLLQANGFIAKPYEISGLMVPGVANQISMRFAIMDPKTSASRIDEDGIFSTPDIIYSSRDPYFFPIKEAPTVIKEFQLNCALID